MTNLAEKRIVESRRYCRGNIVYGCFGEFDAKRIQDNRRQSQKAQIREGICFGLKCFFSLLVGVVIAQNILDWQNVRVYALPAFCLPLLWAACAGSVFCVMGFVRNLLCFALRK